ncbi:MAG: SRPBCC domain-containing protein [Sphingomonadaceae bacterium]|nr:SRPBCC domain-containing protein [Sphingomonadaceae bacterium]
MTGFTVYIHVSRPPAEVYEAVADPAILSHYFTTGGAQGRLETGGTVIWDFADFPGAFPVEVVSADEKSDIELRWAASDPDAETPYQTTVIISFAAVDGGRRTKVTISESGWPDTPGGRRASYGNCMGWSQMLAALKCWLEHGINLRDGAYK